MIKQFLLELILKLANRYLSVDDDWNLYISDDSWKHEEDTKTEEEKHRWENAVRDVPLELWANTLSKFGVRRIAKLDEKSHSFIYPQERMIEVTNVTQKSTSTSAPIESNTSD